MLNPRLAYRYAKALLEIAVEKGQLEEVFQDVQWLKAICKSNPDFVSLLRSPIIKADKKQKIVAAITDGKVNPITQGFIRLLIAKGREVVLSENLGEFVNQYKAHKNIKTVPLSTGVPVGDCVMENPVAQVDKVANFENV